MAVRAPEFPEGLEWVQSTPLRIQELRGRVVLLDFWTYGCINCLHILPELRKLEEKFPDVLLVIGVHSGKYIAERDTRNIREAARRLDIRHPIVNDRQFRIWRSYAVNAWPTITLIDPSGYVVAQHAGERTAEMLTPAISRIVLRGGQGGYLIRSAMPPLAPQPPATALAYPSKLAFDARTRRMAIADTGHNRVLVADVAADGSLHVTHTIGSSAGLRDGELAQAQLREPYGLAWHADKLFIADTGNHCIRVANLATGELRTIAGTGEQARRMSAPGQPRETALNSPWDVLVHDDRLYIAMAGFHQIWRSALDGTQLEIWAGSGAEEVFDAERARAAFAQPSGLATDGTTLFVADPEGSAVRALPFDGDEVTTLVGTGLFDFGDRDGSGDDVRLQHALGVAWYDDRLYLADTYNGKLKILDPESRTCTTWQGTEHLWEPGGLCVADEYIYVADTNNNRIVRINFVGAELEEVRIEGLQ